MSTDLDQLKTDPAVIRLYSERVRLRKEGREFVGLCPFHSEKTPSFKIYEKDGVHLWKCFGCGRGGNIFQFIEQKDHIPMKSAINLVRDFLGQKQQTAENREKVDRTFRAVGADDEKKTITFSLEKFAVYEGALEKTESALAALQKRGIDLATAKRLHVGFRQDVGKIAGEKNQDIADKGWLAFPRIENGIIVGVHYRSIVRKAFCRQPNMKTALFNSDAIDPLEPIYVVEGELDALSLERAGFRAVSWPNSTTKATPEMKDLLREADKIILAGDTDLVGSDAMTKLWGELKDRTYLLRWPDGMKDANDVLMKAAGGDLFLFKTIVEQRTLAAESIPMPGVYSLPEAMMSSSRTNLADHPNRLHFPWPSVDKMAILLPGSVMNIFATNALADNTEIVTPTGVKVLKNIKIGDKIIGVNGRPTTVTAVFPKGKRQMYRVDFSDGTSVRCDAEHLWTVRDRHHLGSLKVLETQQIMNSRLKSGRSSFRYRLPFIDPVQFESNDLPLSPYLLGALLGDGSIKNYVRITNSTDKRKIIPQLRSELPPNHVVVKYPNDPQHWYIRNARPYRKNQVRIELKNLGLLGRGSRDKFIPSVYLVAKIEDRIRLLQGLMDTDGSASKTGSMSYGSMSPQLAQDVLRLIRSLGGYGKIHRQKSGLFIVNFYLPLTVPVFSISRKEQRRVSKSIRKHKNIVSVSKDGFSNAICLAVDAEDGLFLVNDFIPTHNTKMGKTAFVMNLTMFGAQKYNEVVLNYQCELSTDEFSNIAAAYVLRKDRNHLTKEDNEKAGKFLLHSNIKYYVGSDPTLTRVTPVLDLIEAAIQRLGATVVVLDHIHFIVRNEENPVQAMENAMQRIKNMAKKYGVKFIVVGQPRKVNQQNRGKVVHIGDWKGSESGTSDADAIFAIHRDYIKIKDPLNPPKDDYEPKTEVHLLGARSKGDGGTFAVLVFHGDLAAFWEETKLDPPPNVDKTNEKRML